MVKIEHVKIINEVNEESFKKSIEREYQELFKEIGLMDGEISIKFKNGACPTCRTNIDEFLILCRNHLN